MRVPLPIPGTLMRRGPLHGYRLKGLIDEQGGEAVRVKPPTICCHLEKLHRGGHLAARRSAAGRRP